MKSTLITIVFGAFLAQAEAQSKFSNIWKLQNSKDEVCLKIRETQSKLSFVYEGTDPSSSRTYFTGDLIGTRLNQYIYKDKNSDCELLINFMNTDSAYLSTTHCDLYLLLDSTEGLFTTNSNDLITPKIFGYYDKLKEDEIQEKLGDYYSIVKDKCIFSKNLDAFSSKNVFFASSEDKLENDPEVVFYVQDGKISIFYRSNGSITTFRSPFHTSLNDTTLEWIQKPRIQTILSDSIQN